MIVRLFEAEHRFAYLESRFYVSIIGFPILLSGILQIYPRILKWVRNSIFIIILCLYITITLSYSTNFRNPLLHWNHVIDMSPRSADAHFNMGIVLMDVANNPQLAVESYKRAIALNPLNSQYHNNLGIIYGRLGLLIQAEDEFRTSIGINRSDPLPHCNLGYVYYLNHDILEAEKQWKKALTLDSNFTEVLMKLMNLYLQEKKYEQAKYYYQKLQKLSISVDSTILTHF
jgi:pentatricopeptide repeat protein